MNLQFLIKKVLCAMVLFCCVLAGGNIAYATTSTNMYDGLGEYYGEFLSMAVGSDGFARIVHYDYTGAETAILFERCLNEDCTSRTTNTAATIPNASGSTGQLKMELISDIPYIVYMQAKGAAGANNLNLDLIQCTDVNCSSTNISTITTPYLSPEAGFNFLDRFDIELGSDNLLRIVYPDGTTNFPTLMRCTNLTCTSNSTETIESVGESLWFPDLKLDRNDYPQVFYHDHANDSVKIASCSDTTCATAPTVTTIESVGGHDNYDHGAKIALSQSDVPYLLWRRFSDGATRFAQCHNKTCSTSTKRTLDTEDSGYWMDMEIAGNGLPTLMYDRYFYDGGLPLGFVGLFRIQHCLDILCYDSVITDTPEDDEDTGYWIEADVDPDGLLHIVYLDYTDYNESFLVHVTCSNAYCNNQALETAGSAIGAELPKATTIAATANGSFLSENTISVVENSAGFATIAYADGDAEEVVVVRCTQENCYNSERTVIAEQDSQSAMIVLGNDSFPRVLYDDGFGNSGVLSYAVCLDASCINSNTYIVDSSEADYYVWGAAIDDNGDIHFLYSSNGGGFNYGYCDNADCSFPTLTQLNASASIAEAGIAKGADGNMRVSYSYNYEDLYYVRCTNLECSSNNSNLILDATPGDSLFGGELIVDGDGTSHIAYSLYFDDGWAYGGVPWMYMMTCTNADCTTNTSRLIDNNWFSGEYTDIVLNKNGFPTLVYQSLVREYGIRIAECRDATCSTLDRTILRHGTDTNVGSGNGSTFVAAAAGADAVHVIAEYNVSSGSNRRHLEYYYYDQTDRQYPLTSFIDDKEGAAGLDRGTAAGPRIKVGSDGLPRIAHIDNWFGSIRLDVCANIECTERTWQTLEQNGSPFEQLGMDLASDDRARIIYRNYDTDLHLIRCTNNSCSSLTDISIASETDEIRHFEIIVNQTNDFPSVIYYTMNGSNQGHLKFLSCSDAACTSPTIETITSSVVNVNYTYRPGLALGSDGYARFGYWADNGQFRFVQCTNATCSTRNDTAVHTSVTTDDYYQESSVVMGADGFARIAFLDTNLSYNAEIQFLKCNNASCSANSVQNISAGEIDGAGWALAMDLDGEGNPWVAFYYYEPTSGLSGLGIISCNTADCASVESNILRNPLTDPLGTNLSWWMDAESDLDGNPLILNTNIRRSGDNYYGAQTDDNTQYLEMIICNTPNCELSAVYTGSVGDFSISGAAVSSGVTGQSNVTYGFDFDEVQNVFNGYVITLQFPDAYDASFASLNSGDVTVSGTNVNVGATTVDIDSTNNIVTITLATDGVLSEGLSIDVANLDNPGVEGVYGAGLTMYDSSGNVVAQGISFFEISNNVTVTAIVAEAIIMTLTNSSGGDGVNLVVDPAVGSGQDLSENTTINVATNSASGYVLKARLDDGSGQARLVDGNGNFIDSDQASGENYFSYTARNDGTGSATAAEQDFGASTSTLLDNASGAIGLGTVTDSQDHTINYDLNVNFLTPAGVYTGTIYYTVVASF